MATRTANLRSFSTVVQAPDVRLVRAAYSILEHIGLSCSTSEVAVEVDPMQVICMEAFR